MTSLLTNTSAMAALDILRTIDKSLETTQSRVSSGYRVKGAYDNAAYWSIATTMRSDNKALSAVKDALGLGAAKSDTAYTAMQSAIDVISEIKAKLVAAREPGVDKLKIDKELGELKNQLTSIAQSASFSGENWLYNASSTAIGTKQMIGSFVRSPTGVVSVETLDFNAAASVLVDTVNATRGLLTRAFTYQVQNTAGTMVTGTFYLINGGGTGGTGTEIRLFQTSLDTDIEIMLGSVDKILSDLTDSASTLGATKKRIELQDDFVADLMDTIDKGVGRLVDADMNQESTRLKALQTQQQLGIQALSIANTSADNILTLFRQ